MTELRNDVSDSPIVQSTFDFDDEGWTVVDDAGVSAPSFVDEGDTRYITGTGYLEATGASAALAEKALKAAIRTKQAAVNQVIGTYTDIDGNSYSNCLLTSYEPLGSVEISAGSGTKTARVAVRFVILEQNPS